MEMKTLLFALFFVCATASALAASETIGLLFDPCSAWPDYVSETDQFACRCTMARYKWVSEGEGLQLAWQNEQSRTVAIAASEGVPGLKTLSLALSVHLLSQESSGQTYFCVLSNRWGVISSRPYRVPRYAFGPRTLNVTAPVTQIPRNGSDVTVTCAAISNPKPNFQWPSKPSGAVIHPVLDQGGYRYSQSMTFNPRAFGDGDVITCAVTNPRVTNSTKEGRLILHFKTEIQFTDCIQFPKHVMPSDQSVCTCSFSPTLPSTHTWVLNWTDPLGNTLQKTTSNTNLTLRLATSNIHENALPYLCTVANELGIYSTRAYVPHVAHVPENVTITSPLKYVLQHRSEATLTCTAKGDMAMTFLWLSLPPGAKYDRVKEMGPNTFGQTVTFDPKVVDRQWKVVCQVTNTDFPTLYQKDEFLLSLPPKPLPVGCMTHQFITPETTPVCSCVFSLKDQRPGLWTLQWTDPLGRVVHQVNSTAVVDGSDTLSQALEASVIAPEYDGRLFKCTVSNQDGYFSSFLYIPRLAPKPELKDCVRPDVYVTADQQFNCTCTFSLEGRPPRKWTLSWLDPDGPTLMTKDSMSGDREVSLTLDSSLVRRHHSGHPFLCVVSTQAGVFSLRDFRFRMAYGPDKVTVVSEMIEDHYLGHRYELQCRVRHVNPAPIVEWSGLPYSARHRNCTSSREVFCTAITFPTGAIPDGANITCRARNPELENSLKETTVLVATALPYAPRGPIWEVWLALLTVVIVLFVVAGYCAFMTARHGEGKEEEEEKPLVEEAAGLAEEETAAPEAEAEVEAEVKEPLPEPEVVPETAEKEVDIASMY